MKKVLPVLILSGLFAVLLVPVTVSVALAADCSAGCRVITPSQACNCGPTALPRYAADGVTLTNEVCDNGVVRAACTTGASGAADPVAPTVVNNAQDLLNLIAKIGNWVFGGVMAVASVFLIYAGFLYVTAGGDPQGATKAKQMLTNALIGVVVALLARGLVQVIQAVIK